MRFAQGLYVLVLIILALALICAEIPESRTLTDDVSNDVVVRPAAPATTTVRIAADHFVSKLMLPKSEILISWERGILFCATATPFSGEDLLHLLSVQRK